MNIRKVSRWLDIELAYPISANATIRRQPSGSRNNFLNAARWKNEAAPIFFRLPLHNRRRYNQATRQHGGCSVADTNLTRAFAELFRPSPNGGLIPIPSATAVRHREVDADSRQLLEGLRLGNSGRGRSLLIQLAPLFAPLHALFARSGFRVSNATRNNLAAVLDDFPIPATFFA